MAFAESFTELVRIVAKLRDPNGGCPWDLEQTHQTLKPYVIEEAHEVVDAIDAGPQKLVGELGDLLLQVVLHAQIAAEAKTFDIDQVIQRISSKLITRHPHVFGDKKVSGTKDVLENWEQIKQKELKGKESILDGVPRSMPALLRAARLGDKASRVGFDWPDAPSVKTKIAEELNEFVSATAQDDTTAIDEEFGDLLFALSQWARKTSRNPEELLNKANDKFTRRFKSVEALLTKPMKEYSLDELETLWQQVKSKENR